MYTLRRKVGVSFEEVVHIKVGVYISRIDHLIEEISLQIYVYRRTRP